MADDIDRAQAINEQHLDDALAAHKRKTAAGDRGPGTGKKLTVADSALICIDCERPIPARRREAVPGCTRCIDCQTLHEHWRPL